MNPIDKVSLKNLASSVSCAIDFLRDYSKDHVTLSVGQANLLLQLYVQGEILQTSLAEITGSDRSGISRYIARLGPGERVRGSSPGRVNFEPGLQLVEAEDDLNNRKFNVVRLTQLGRSVVEEALERAARYIPK